MRTLTCISCPKGCIITQDHQEIDGYQCKRGLDYAIAEWTAPKRYLTSTIKLVDGTHQRVSVISNQPLPKDRLFDAMAIIKHTSINAPVQINQVLISNILNLNIDIIATRSIDKKG